MLNVNKSNLYKLFLKYFPKYSTRTTFEYMLFHKFNDNSFNLYCPDFEIRFTAYNCKPRLLLTDFINDKQITRRVPVEHLFDYDLIDYVAFDDINGQKGDIKNA